MNSEWPRENVLNLQEKGILLVEDGNHGEYRPRPHEFCCEGVAFIRASDMNCGHVLFDTADKINATARERIRKGVGRPGDVLFSHKGTVGKLALVPDDAPPFVCSPQTTFWRTLDQDCLDHRYLYCFMRSALFRDQYMVRKGETDMADYVSLTAQRTFFVSLPPIEEQRAIGRVIGELDDKIELNRRMNATLDAMARAIFRSWFVDFDPVVARAEGCKPALIFSSTAALFPEKFEESDEGLVPTGWKLSTVGKEFRLTMGTSPPGATYNEDGDGIPFFQGRRDFGFRYPTTRVYCTAPKRFADQHDTLVSVRAPVGDVNMATERCCVGRGVAAVRHKSGSRSYTYYAMHDLGDEFAAFEGTGTVFGSIGKTEFENIKRITPPDELIEKFHNVADPLDQQIEVNTRESASLAAIRDALLPQLLSGNIRLRDAERVVEEVTV